MRKAILIAALLVAGTASASVPNKSNGPFSMYLHSDDIHNVFYGSPPGPSGSCEDGPGNPGTIKCTGEAGENPDDKGDWGAGDRGRGR